MTVSRRRLLKAAAFPLLIGGVGAPFVARAQQAQFHAQIDANDVALRDTEKEVTVGTRTRLDTLNAQQELFATDPLPNIRRELTEILEMLK